MAPKNTEDMVYRAVGLREIEIDESGHVWRIANRHGLGRAGTSHTLTCTRHRAEHDQGSYLMVRATIEGKRYYALAHRLVWRHFNGPIPEGLTINHKNGNKKDNRPDNLELATYSEQQIHARQVLKRGRDQRGVKNAMVKLTAVQVCEIRAMRETGMKLAAIADLYGVAFQTISKIVRGDRWA